jgi:hypothetical protein
LHFQLAIRLAEEMGADAFAEDGAGDAGVSTADGGAPAVVVV